MKTMRAIILGILFSTLFQNIQAQQAAEGEAKNKIKGVLVDAGDKSPIEFANIALYTIRDSVIVTWSISDEKGAFELSKIPKGEYKLAISFVGYEKTSIQQVSMNKPDFTMDLGEIKLNKEVTSIKEVEVVGVKKTYESKIDKKVINVSKDINSTGGTAVDLIKNVPGMTVDADGVVSLRGNTSISVLIDGRPTSIDATKLDQLPSVDIESIEIITNPSAKYNPEGKSGIINLKLKQKKAAGFSGNAMFTAGTGNKYNGSINLNYNLGIFNFFASYNGMSKQVNSTRYLWREAYNMDSTYYLQQDAKTHLDIASNKFTLGAGINLNPKNSVTMSYSFNPVNKTDVDETYSQYFDQTMNPTGNVLTDNAENSKELSQDYLLGYRKTFDKKGEELTMDYTFSKTNSAQNQPLTYHYPTYDESIEMVTNNSNYNSNLQINWVNPLSKNSKIESGIQAIIRGSENNFHYFNQVSDSLIEDISQRDLFIYNEQIYAAYTAWSAKYEKINLLAGLRLEQTFIDGKQEVTTQNFNRQYFNFYPSFNFGYSINENNELQLSYSRRINRPNARMLNPFADRSNPEVYRSGNPGLQPEYVNSLEAGYNSTLNKTVIGVSVFYKQITNQISQMIELDSNGVSHMYPENMELGQNYGFELTFEQPIAKWWKINGNGSFFRNIITASNEEDENSNYSYNGRINSTWTPAKKTSVQLVLNYSGPIVGIISKMNPQYSADLAVKRDFYNDKLSLTLRASDIFNTLKNSYTSWGDNFSANNWRKTETQVLYFTLAYKFGTNGVSKKSKENNYENSNVPEMF